MSDIDIDIEVEGIQKVGELLEDGIKEGAQKSLDSLLDVGKDSAKNIISANDLVWTGELYGSINKESSFSDGSYSGTVSADSPHAAPIEFGAEYTTEGPPVSALIPWVKVKLADWNVDMDPDDRGPDPFSRDSDPLIPELEPNGENTNQKVYNIGPDDEDIFVDADEYPDKELPDGTPVSNLGGKRFTPDDSFYGEGEEYSVEDDGYPGQRIAVHQEPHFPEDDSDVTFWILTFDEEDSPQFEKEGDNNIERTEFLPDEKIVASSSETESRRSSKAISRLISDAEWDTDKDLTEDLITDESQRLLDEGNREEIERLLYNIEKVENVADEREDSDKVAGYIKPQNSDKSYLPSVVVGINEDKVGSSLDTLIQKTIRHEFQHGSQIHHDHVTDDEINEKVQQYRDTNPSIFTYEYLQKGDDGDPDANYPYGPAHDNLILEDDIDREAVFNTWESDIKDQIRHGLNDRAGLANYEDVEAVDLFGDEIVPEEGDYLRGDFDNIEDKHVQISKIDEGEITLVKVKNGRNNKVSLSFYEDGSTLDGDVTGYAPSDSVDTSPNLYYDPEENPVEAYREVVSRSWYRGVIGTEYDADSPQATDINKELGKWSPTSTPYALANSMETGAGLKEIAGKRKFEPIKDPQKSYAQVVRNLVQRNPTLIFAYVEWYNGLTSSKFEEQIVSVTDSDTFEEAIEKLNPEL